VAAYEDGTPASGALIAITRLSTAEEAAVVVADKDGHFQARLEPGEYALAITATGLAGVIAFAVNQRTHEIGIRMALGAQRTGVLWMVLRQAAVLVVVGLPLGLIGALAFNRLFAGLLFAVRPTDPATYLAVSLLLIGVAGVACLLPARRATAIDPLTALRSE